MSWVWTCAPCHPLPQRPSQLPAAFLLPEGVAPSSGLRLRRLCQAGRAEKGPLCQARLGLLHCRERADSGLAEKCAHHTYQQLLPKDIRAALPVGLATSLHFPPGSPGFTSLSWSAAPSPGRGTTVDSCPREPEGSQASVSHGVHSGLLGTRPALFPCLPRVRKVGCLCMKS